MPSFLNNILQLNQQVQLIVLWLLQNSYTPDLPETYTSLDLSLPQLRLQAQKDPAAFVASLKLPAFLANLQYVPSLLPALVAANLPPGQVVASSTQSYYLAQEAAKYPGQVAFVDVPLAEVTGKLFIPTDAVLEELSTQTTAKDVVTGILQGRLCVTKNRSAALGAYLQRFLQQDIMELTTVSDALKFYKFLCCVAAMTGSMLNYAALAEAAAVTAPTAKQWLRFLEGSGMLYFVHSLEKQGPRRLMKAPKLYFRDTGVAAYLLELQDAAALVQSPYYKGLWETYLVNNIREEFIAQGQQHRLSFYRDSNGKEISLIIEAGRVLYPVEITKDLFNLRKIEKKFKLLEPVAAARNASVGNGCIIGLGCSTLQLKDKLWQVNGALL